LGKVDLLFARGADVIGPGLEFEGRDVVGAGGAAAEEFGFAETGVSDGGGGAVERGAGVGAVFVVGDLGGADIDTVRLVVLRDVRLLFAVRAQEIGPSLELHRRRDRVFTGRAVAVELGLAEGRVRARGGGAVELGAGVGAVFVERDLSVAYRRSVGFVVLREVGLFFAREAFEIGPRLKLQRGHVVGARRAAAEEFGLDQRRVDVRGGGAVEIGAGVGAVFVVRDRRVADVDAVCFVILREVGLFFAGEALVIGPGLELHVRRDDVGAGGAQAEETRLAEGRIGTRRSGAVQVGAGVRAVLVERNLRRTNRDAVRPVILGEVDLLFARDPLEVRPSLKLEGGDVVGAGGTRTPELGLTEGRIHARDERAVERGAGVGAVFVVGDLRGADVVSIRLVILREVRLLFTGEALEVRPRLELERRDVVGAGGAQAEELRFALSGVDARGGGAVERGAGVGAVFVVGDRGVANGAVGFVRLRVVGLFLARDALEIGPILKLEARNVVGAGGAATEEFRFAERRVDARVDGAVERGAGVGAVFVVGDLRVTDVEAVRFVILSVVGLFLGIEALEVGPRLKREGRDVGRSLNAAAVQLRFTLSGVGSRVGCAVQVSARVGAVFVVGDRRVADVGAVGLVVLGVVGLFFTGSPLEISPSLELQRRNVVGIRRAAAEQLRFALSGVVARHVGAVQVRSGVGAVFVV